MRTLELGPTPLPRALSGRLSATLAPAVTGERAKSLVGQLQLECEAMARHALQHGLAVPAELIAQLSALIDSTDGADVDATMAAAPRRSPETPGARARELAAMHRKLAHAVAPATPQGITLLDTERRRGQRFAWLGPVPLIRVLTVASVLFLLAVVGTGLPAEVSSANMQRGFLASSGSTLLWNTLFLLFCAGLGASFATLFHAHRYVANSTYDPKFDASYGARLILGVIAGLILVEMLPADLFRGPDEQLRKTVARDARWLLRDCSAPAFATSRRHRGDARTRRRIHPGERDARCAARPRRHRTDSVAKRSRCALAGASAGT